MLFSKTSDEGNPSVWTTPAPTRKVSAIVIGAGPGGLVCTKELLEQGFEDVVCLERGDRIGGTFTRAYDNLVLTSSATFSMFSDFWVGDGDEHRFWTKAEAVDYWSRYAKHFGVTERIRFGAEVAEVAEDEHGGGGWRVSLASGETLRCERLVLAVGNNSHPRYPDWRDALTAVEVSHSHDYRNASAFAGKRVLVVGGGESGSDVAHEISAVAERCWVSLRGSTGWVTPRKRGDRAADVSTHRGLWGLSREFGAEVSRRLIRSERARRDPVFDVVAQLNERVQATHGLWGTYGTKTLALPRAIAHHGCRVVGEITEVEAGGRRLRTADGEVLEGIDAVVFSTGYDNVIGFLPEALRSCDPRSLYKHMFHPAYGDRIAWIGWARPGFGSQFPIMEMQARLLALVARGLRSLPSPAGLEQGAAEDRARYLAQFEHNARRIRSLVDYHRFMDDLAGLVGCRPPLREYLARHPRLWLRMVYGPMQGTQFRLRGPGAKVDLAHEILAKIPVSTFNPVVKAGLVGRLQQGLRRITRGAA